MKPHIDDLFAAQIRSPLILVALQPAAQAEFFASAHKNQFLGHTAIAGKLEVELKLGRSDKETGDV